MVKDSTKSIKGVNKLIDPLIIYIDQNHWDKLEKVFYKKLKDDLVQDVLDKLNDLKSRNKIKIVLDLQRAIETSQRKYEDSRKDLSKLMLSLSEEFFVIPWVYLQDLEIENYFLRKLRKPENNIREMAIGKGFPFMMGETPRVTSDSITLDNLILINKKLKEYYPELMKIEFERYKNKDEKFKLKYVQEAEDARKDLIQMDSDEERKRYLIKHDFITLIKKIRSFLNKIEEKRLPISEDVRNLLLSKKAFPQDMTNNKKQAKFMQEFPIIFTHSTLVSFRDRDLRRKIDPNDLIDIVSYVVPISYLDVVLGENYFITIAKQAKLDELYGCNLFSKIENFLNFLNQI